MKWALQRGESFQAYARKTQELISSSGSLKEARRGSQENTTLAHLKLVL